MCALFFVVAVLDDDVTENTVEKRYFVGSNYDVEVLMTVRTDSTRITFYSA